MGAPERNYVEAVLLNEGKIIVACLVVAISGAFLCGRASAQTPRNGPDQCEEIVCPAGPQGPPGVCEQECEERVCGTTIELCDLPKNPCDNFNGRWVCYIDSNGLEVLRVKPRVRAQKGEKRVDALRAWIAEQQDSRGCVDGE